MTDFLVYDLKTAVLIAVFYLFYRLLLARETFHRFNRVVLLATAAASFLLPLCVITIHQTVEQPVTVVVPEMGSVELVAVEEEPTFNWALLGCGVLVAGGVVLFFRLVFSIWKVKKMIRHSERHVWEDGITIAVTDIDTSPFSWMNYIVMNRSDYEQRHVAILAHERGHILARHSWDIVLVDLMSVVQWFNPAIWLLRSDLRAIHEYEADAAVLSQGINARQYQYLLIRKAVGCGGYSTVNGFHHSTLKNRITMMLRNKSSHRQMFKCIALLPIVGAALALNAETLTEYVSPTEMAQADGLKGASVLPSASTLSSNLPDGLAADLTEEAAVDKMTSDDPEALPEFPGGNGEMMVWLSQNLKYPETKAEGRVIVSFTVEADGSITGVKTLQSVAPELDAEAVRVVGSMPKWKPGMQDGKPVAVKFSVPIVFKRQGTSLPKTDVAAGESRVLPEVVSVGNAQSDDLIQVNGQIVDDNDDPIVGAVIRVRGTTKGAVTDAEGKFQLAAPKGSFLTTGFVGMASATTAVTSDKPMTIRMKTVDLSSVKEPSAHRNDVPAYYLIDGKRSSKEELEKLNPADIESMYVDKSNPKKPVVKIKTKKAK